MTVVVVVVVVALVDALGIECSGVAMLDACSEQAIVLAIRFLRRRRSGPARIHPR